MHLTENELAGLTHGETVGISKFSTEHLASCPQCTERLAVLRAADRQAADLLRLLDHPAASSSSAAFLRDLDRRRRRMGAIAAGLALCVAGAAAALPNSPLHHALMRAFSKTEGPHPAGAGTLSNSIATARRSGVAVIPGESVDVRFIDPQPGGRVRLILADGPSLSVTADGDAAFSIHQSQLDVRDRGVAMNFTLDVPRSVPDVTVRAGDDTIFGKHSGVISTSRPADASGAYTFSFSHPSTARAPRLK
jgi:hypothetical protein